MYAPVRTHVHARTSVYGVERVVRVYATKRALHVRVRTVQVYRCLSLSLFRVAARRVPDYSPFSFLLPRVAYLCDFSLSLIHVFERAITCVTAILITTLFGK